MVIIAIIAFIRQRNKKHRDFVNKHSRAVRDMRAVNKTHRFHFINDKHLKHSYDDRAVYDSISPLDYLRYQLTYFWPSVLQTINFVEENRQMNFDYQNEIHSIESFGNFDAPTNHYSTNKLLKDEKKLFNNLIRHPRTMYSITVTLVNVTVTGVRRTSKSKTFYMSEIRENIERINNKDGDYYLDNEVFESICRVEKGKVTRKMKDAIIKRDGGHCLKCGSTEDLEIDHIVPIFKYGKTEYDNLQTLCHKCNEEKGAATISYLPKINNDDE